MGALVSKQEDSRSKMVTICYSEGEKYIGLPPFHYLVFYLYR